MKIVFVTTGGTIDKIYFDTKNGFEIGEPQVMKVLREANVDVECELVPLLRKDSLDLTDEDRRKIFDAIADRPERLFVVTHGTDTMVDTAKVLLDLPADKTVVLTGAMQPARFRVTDAVFNISAAMMAVQLQPPGVYICMNGRLFDPRYSRKNVEAGRFEVIS